MRPLRGGRSPVITSSSSRCPLPSTPAIADDLAGVHDQIDAAQGRQPAIVRRLDIAQHQPRLAPSGRVGRDGAFELAADHQPSERPSVDRAGGHGRDQPAAAQHRDAIGEAQHLVELVADEDDRAAIGREARAERPEARPPPAASARRSARRGSGSRRLDRALSGSRRAAAGRPTGCRHVRADRPRGRGAARAR